MEYLDFHLFKKPKKIITMKRTIKLNVNYTNELFLS